MRRSSKIADVWQLHVSETAEKPNTEEALTANVQKSLEYEAGHCLEVAIEANGNYSVLNRRNGFSET